MSFCFALEEKKNEWKIKKQLQRVMNILACLKALNKCWWKWNTFSREMDWNCCYVFLLIYICVYDAHSILVLKNKNKHKQFVFYAVNFSFLTFYITVATLIWQLIFKICHFSKYNFEYISHGSLLFSATIFRWLIWLFQLSILWLYF